MKRKTTKVIFRNSVIYFFSVGLTLVTILATLFVARIMLEREKASESALKAKDLEIQSLHLTIQTDETIIKTESKRIEDLNEKVEDLVDRVQILNLLSELNSCSACGKHNLSYIDGNEAISISCNDCQTHVDFDRRYSISNNKIKEIWNGLQITKIAQ